MRAGAPATTQGHAPRRAAQVLKHMQWRCRSDGDAVAWRTDPRFFFAYSPDELATYAQRLSCHLLVVHGKQSHRVPRDAAQVRGVPAVGTNLRLARFQGSSDRVAALASALALRCPPPERRSLPIERIEKSSLPWR